MSLVDAIAKVLREELRCHTAWPPIGTKVELGDYGVLKGGVFEKTGSLRKMQVPFATEKGDDVQLNFTSADASVTYFAANAAVDVLPQGAIDASMRIKFQAADALMIRAGKITVEAIADVGAVTARLKNLHGWTRSDVVVGKVLRAEAPLLIGTRTAGTEVTFAGDTSALKSLQLGQFDAAVHCASNKELGLKVHGDSGVIGVRLFRVAFFGTGPSFLGPEQRDDARDEFEWIDPAKTAAVS